MSIVAVTGDNTFMATTLIPVAEYLAAGYKPDREYIDGVVVERNLGEFDHANLQTALVVWFRNRQREWNIRAVVEQRVQTGPTRFRVPDVTVIDRAQPVEQILTRPPLIVIEVLSPEDTWRRVEEKTSDYLEFGVSHVWILDPATRRAWAATRAGFAEKRILEAAGTPIAVDLNELFDQLE
jgi:Uma2 family endonuclease